MGIDVVLHLVTVCFAADLTTVCLVEAVRGSLVFVQSRVCARMEEGGSSHGHCLVWEYREEHRVDRQEQAWVQKM